MAVKLYVRDNQSGNVHEIGKDQHDALILNKNGTLSYVNMQSMVGTKFPEEGYSFCDEDGNDPNSFESIEICDAYLTIGNKPINYSE